MIYLLSPHRVHPTNTQQLNSQNPAKKQAAKLRSRALHLTVKNVSVREETYMPSRDDRWIFSLTTNTSSTKMIFKILIKYNKNKL